MRPTVNIPLLLFALAPLALGQEATRRDTPLSEQELSDMAERGKFHFTVCDSNTNGWISFREAHASLGIDKEEYRVFDTSGDGRLSSQEFRRRYPRMLELFRAKAAALPSEAPELPTEPESALPLTPTAKERRALLPPMDPSQPTFLFPTPEDLLAAFDRDASDGLSRDETSNALVATGSRLSVDVLFARTDRDATSELELEELGPLSFFVAKRIPERLARTEEIVAETSADLVPTRTAALGSEPNPIDPAPRAPAPLESLPVAIASPEPESLEPAGPEPTSIEPDPIAELLADPIVDRIAAPVAVPVSTPVSAPVTKPVTTPIAAPVALATESPAAPEPPPAVVEARRDDVPRRRIGEPVAEPERVEPSVRAEPLDERPELTRPVEPESSALETFEALVRSTTSEPPARAARKPKRKRPRAPAFPKDGTWTPGHFGKLDADGDGSIECEDLERLLAPARSAVRIGAIIAALDGDGDGRLNVDELVRSLSGR